MAKKKGLELVFFETYPSGTTDFSNVLTKVKATKLDVLVAASIRLQDLVSITRQMREMGLNVRMFSAVPYGLLPDYYSSSGRRPSSFTAARFGRRAFPTPETWSSSRRMRKSSTGAPAVQSAGAYAACQVFAEMVRRTRSLDSDKLREALLALKTKTVLGDFAIDERGFQIAHKAITIQWQDGKQVVVWPDELVSGKLRLPTPPWSER